MNSWLASALGYTDQDKGAASRERVNKNDKALPTTRVAMDEVRKHKSRQSCWLVVNGKVYDVTSFVDSHPGGDIILDGAGRDATDLFNDIGHSPDAAAVLSEMQIGVLANDVQ